MPDRVLRIMTLGLVVLLVITVVVALVVWHTPGTHQINVPSVGRA